MRKENNKIVEEGIKTLRRKIIKLWRRTEIKMKRERGKYNVLRSIKNKDGLPSLTISIEYLI